MELLNRYVQAMAHYLPAEQKQDIMRELRANLLDELESLGINASNSSDSAALTTFLQRQDHPQRIAQSYAPQYPLVASEDMGLYKTIVLKGLLVLFVYAVVTAGSYLINAQSVNAIAFLLVVLSSVWDNIGVMLIGITATFYLLVKVDIWHSGDTPHGVRRLSRQPMHSVYQPLMVYLMLLPVSLACYCFGHRCGSTKRHITV